MRPTKSSATRRNGESKMNWGLTGIIPNGRQRRRTANLVEVPKMALNSISTARDLAISLSNFSADAVAQAAVSGGLPGMAWTAQRSPNAARMLKATS